MSFCNGLFSSTHLCKHSHNNSFEFFDVRSSALEWSSCVSALLRFCIRLGSNYFNYTVAAFSADVWLILTLLSMIHYRLCPNQLIKSSQTRFVNLSYFQVGTFFPFFHFSSFSGRSLLRLIWHWLNCYFSVIRVFIIKWKMMTVLDMLC